MQLSRFRPRLTVRRLMVAVAVAGICCAVAADHERRHRFQRLAEHHGSKMRPDIGYGQRVSSDPEDVLNLIDGQTQKPISLARVRWHERLHDKYERAVRYPWLPVATDPPEPK